jgi:hypothetical protein
MRQFTATKSRGPAATTPGLHPGNDGSSPSGITVSQEKITYRSSRSSPECSPGCQPGDRGFESHRGRLIAARYANWQSGEAQTFVQLRVQLPPVSLKSFNRVVFLTAACKAVVHEISEVDDERFKSFTTHSVLRVSSSIVGPLVYRHRTAAPQAAKAGSIPARVNSREYRRPSGETADTRRSERRAFGRGSSNLPLVNSRKPK